MVAQQLRLLVIWALLVTSTLADEPLRFRVTLSKDAASQPITGRLLVFLSGTKSNRPMQSLDWFHPEPFCATEVKDLAPGQSVTLDDLADSFPEPLSQLPLGQYRVQAVLDQDFYYPEPAVGPGNIHSDVIEVDLRANATSLVEITLNQVIPEHEYKDQDLLKFVQIKSPQLSAFHGREVIDRAAVILPASYHNHPDRRYPVYYEVSGFGDSLDRVAKSGVPQGRAEAGPVEFIQVILTGECKWGHHVYANSATNGPRGDALVHEMIPQIDTTFRTVADPRARFVGGHSSGGWSSLWLQIRYPNAFGGVWSSSPDPVDFRDWQGTNLYAVPTLSVFIDPAGDRRPLARFGPQVALFYDSFCKMDDVLGRGGQLRSFEAVFSARDAHGQPSRCWDRSTGKVDPAIVEQWKAYDIGLQLEQNWPTLKDQLAGKIHIVMGDLDTFYLNGATRRLDERLKALGSDAVIEFLPAADHFATHSVMANRRGREMRAAYQDDFDIEGHAKEEKR